jgi:hypothetical protein
MATQQLINIGSQPNDGTGDSVYVAFQKVNSNFNDIYTLLGYGAGFSFLRLKEAPGSLTPNAIMQVNALGTKFVNKILVAGTGMSIDTVSSSTEIRIINTSSRLVSDRSPQLGGDLDALDTYNVINMPFPSNDGDAVSRKWVYENFLNRDGVTVYDTTSSSEIPYNQKSVLRDNIEMSSVPVDPTHLVNKTYVDDLIETSGFASRTNFYVSIAGDDNRFNIPTYKRGRNFAYAFKTVNRAARAAQQYIDASQIVLGPYQKTITHAEGLYKSTVAEITTSTVLPASSFGVRLRIDLDPSSINIGTDPYINRSIFPGSYLIGARSEAVGLVESIVLDTINGYEYYDITPYDYAKPYRITATPDNILDNQVEFTFGVGETIDIPDFWIGYKFLISNASYNVIGYGTITAINTTYDASLNVVDTITVDFTNGQLPPTDNTIDFDKWHVFTSDYELGEELQWGQRQNKNQCSIMIESGEHEDQYPIKIPENVSLRGDEFRRSVIKPAPLVGTRLPSISSSKWANTYFFRDTQIDGIITAPINTATDYNSIGSDITINSVNNDSITGVVTVTLDLGTAPSAWIGKIFKTSGSIDAIGEVKAVNGATFTVALAQNSEYKKEIGNYSASATIASADWHLYNPVNYAYHYLRDPLRPVDTLTTITNYGGINNAAVLLESNKEFIKAECIAYLTATFTSFVFDAAACAREIDYTVDCIVADLIGGGNIRTINAGDVYRQNLIVPGITETLAAIGYINQIGQSIINNFDVAPIRSDELQIKDFTLTTELVAGSVLSDLIGACTRIVNNDQDFNPPKYNDQMDVLLMNDATLNRYVSAQGHGGFMKVLDPDGQILAKSPYTQTCSSFSKSYNRQVFSGGMFIDGFAGNTKVIPAGITTSTQGYPTKITSTTTGSMGRPSIIPGEGYIRPQTPCFFVNRGITYEVSFISEWDSTNGKGGLNINPLRPGGIANVPSVSATGFMTGSTQTVAVRFSAPTQSGGLNATGTAIINHLGTVTSVEISFPGVGYANGTYTNTTVGSPTLVVGAARLSWTLSSTGSVTAYTIIDGGLGYAVGTTINFPSGPISTATAVVSTVDGVGRITGVTISDGGGGYLTDPAVTFGTDLTHTINIKPGFNVTTDNPLPSEITLITAGNRSMLANDFTQMNDLGYGIFCTNGGLVENVSMFTYYCYSAYYALNGAQCRSIAGSTSYGLNGLKAEGSDPLEVPISIRNKYPMSQIATVNAVGTYTNYAADFTLYVDGLTYPPVAQSQIEVNHSGTVQIYNIRAAQQDDSDSNVYSLSIDDGGGGGLLAAVTDNDKVTIRTYYNQTILDLNAATLTRPSTVLTYAEDPTYVYRVLSYTDLGADTALAEGDTPYNYIIISPYTENGLFRQGLGTITVTNGGSGYTPSSTVAAVIPAPDTAGTGTVSVTVANTDLIYLSAGYNTIMPGSRVTLTSGGGDPNGVPTYVTWVNPTKTIVRVNRIWTWTSGIGLTFSGTQAVGYGVTDGSGEITHVVLSNQGAGYTGTSVRNITFASGVATATAYPVGVATATKIKIVDLDVTSQARIASGLSNSWYYTFGHEGIMYKITGYSNADTTKNAWGELTVERLSDGGSISNDILQTELRAGITANQSGAVTSRISTMRVTGHDFLNVGTGGYADSKYPNDLYGPPNNPADSALEVQQVGKGRVYYATTDQDGNFKVGEFFSVDQGRGTVSISAPVSLTNVDGISFKRGQSLIQKFSVDGTMGGNSNNAVPTERAIQTYVNNRLGLNRNNTVAGVVALGSGFLDLGGVLEMKANVKMGTYRVTNMGDPVNLQDAVTKEWGNVNYVNTSGDTMVGTLVTQILEPTTNGTYRIGDTNKAYTNIYANNFVGTASRALAFNTARTISFTGDVTGSFLLDGAANTSTALTIAANSVALGTDTTGDYVATAGVSGNGLSGSASGEGSSFTVTSNATSANTENTIVFRGASGNFSAGTITATATQAQYADLAEKYIPDAHHAPGTVMIFGGTKEVTAARDFMDRRIAGVVSTNPAYMMNSEQDGGIYIALVGRVPCKVVGKIRKGDMLISSGAPGVATAEKNPALGSVIGKALEDYDSQTVGVIEVVVGRI